MNQPAPANPDGTVLSTFTGGPMDGLTEFIRDTGALRLFASPAVDLNQIMRLAEADIPRSDDILPSREYAYQRTDAYSDKGARIYEYKGERARQ